jgi:hypothetical protein
MFNLFKKKKDKSFLVKSFLVKSFYIIEETTFTDDNCVYNIFRCDEWSDGNLNKHLEDITVYRNCENIIINYNGGTLRGLANRSDAERIYNMLFEEQLKRDEDNNRYITNTKIIKP